MLKYLSILTVLVFLSIVPYSFAQTQNTQQQDPVDTPAEVQQTTLPMDVGTIGTVAASGIALFANDRRDKKQLKEQLELKQKEIDKLNREKKESDEIQDAYQLTTYKIFTASYLYPDKTPKQILELKATNNPLEKNTLADELAIHMNRKVTFSNQTYNIPMPNMSIPTEQTINATTILEQNKVKVKPKEQEQLQEQETEEVKTQ